jgi:hypothetical protein
MSQENEETEEPKPKLRSRRLLPFFILAIGAVVAMYFQKTGPRTQHLRLVLGGRAADVHALDLAYVDESGEVVRQARLPYDRGAPRIVAHEPELVDGDYRLRIDLDTQEGRRSVERRVTLRGDGTTSVDLASAIPE